MVVFSIKSLKKVRIIFSGIDSLIPNFVFMGGNIVLNEFLMKVELCFKVKVRQYRKQICFFFYWIQNTEYRKVEGWFLLLCV